MDNCDCGHGRDEHAEQRDQELWHYVNSECWGFCWACEGACEHDWVLRTSNDVKRQRVCLGCTKQETLTLKDGRWEKTVQEGVVPARELTPDEHEPLQGMSDDDNTLERAANWLTQAEIDECTRLNEIRLGIRTSRCVNPDCERNTMEGTKCVCTCPDCRPLRERVIPPSHPRAKEPSIGMGH